MVSSKDNKKYKKNIFEKEKEIELKSQAYQISWRLNIEQVDKEQSATAQP